MRRNIFLFLYLLPAITVSAQSSDSTATAKKDPNANQKPFQEITVNFNTAALQSYLPFDESFLIVGEAGNDVTGTSCTLTVTKEKDNSVITCKTYAGKVVVPPTSAKSVISYLIDPIPPNAHVYLEFSFVRKVTSLTAYTNMVRTKVDMRMKELAMAGGFLPADLGPLQTQLIDNFKTGFAGYTPIWTGTILDGDWKTNFPPALETLFVNYATFRDKVDDLSDPNTQRGLIPLISPVQASRRLPSLYQYFKSQGMDKAQNVLGKIMASSTSDLIWIYLGQSYVDAAVAGPVAQLPLYAPSLSITATQASLAIVNVKKTMESLSLLAYSIDTEIYGVKDALTKIKGAGLVAGELDLMNKEFQSMSGNLKKAVNLLKAAEENFDAIVTALNGCTTTLDAIVNDFTFTIEGKEMLNTSSKADFETRGSWYISADVGIALLPALKTAAPYYGANIYFTPVNKNAGYTIPQLKKTYCLKHGGPMWLLKHASLSIGVTPASLADPQKRIENLWGNSNLMVGGGLRLGRAFRITGGGLIFRGYANNDPLTTHKELKVTPYISVSVDADLLKFFGKVGALIF